MKPVICLLCGLRVGGPVWAQHWHEKEHHWKQHLAHDADDHSYDHRAGSCYFEPRDVRVIREYYAPRYRKLPPGLEKKLYRTGRLPPGWEKRLQPMPVVVEQQLVPIAPRLPARLHRRLRCRLQPGNPGYHRCDSGFRALG